MRNIIRAALAAVAFIAAPALAQQFPATLPANSIYGRLGIGTGPGQAIPLQSLLNNLPLPNGDIYVGTAANFAAAVPMSGDCSIITSGAITCTKTNGTAFGALATLTPSTGVDTGVQSSQSGNFTVQTTNCGTTFLFSSTSQATVTAAAASGFPAGCKFWLQNTGVYTGSGSARGLLLSSISGATFPTASFVLYPGQKTEFTNVSNTWVETGYDWRKRWKPTVDVTFFGDQGNGSDTATDCLGTTTSACVTINGAFTRIFNNVDYSGGNVRAVLSTTGTFLTGDVLHMAGPLVGGAGNAVFVWNGNGTTTVTSISGGPCVSVFDHAVMEINNLACNGTVGNAGCFAASTSGILFFITTVSTCDPGTSAALTVSDTGSKIEFVNVGLNVNSTGGAPGSIFSITGGGLVAWDAAESISLGNNMAFGVANVVLSELSMLNLNGTSYNSNSHTITGSRFICQRFSVLQGTAGSPNTFIPGNSAGTVGSDCIAP